MKPDQPLHPNRRKLIETLIPLGAISDASVRDKSLSQGHPQTLHRYWARRPLPSNRAIIFATLVDDPTTLDDCKEFPNEKSKIRARLRLLGLIKRLLPWESVDQRNHDGGALIDEARLEIAKSLARQRGDEPPNSAATVNEYLAKISKDLQFFDPFAGGGSIPIEAQRLGLLPLAADLNPLAVLINKALIELPVPFQNREPVNPSQAPHKLSATWAAYSGFADDIRYYGQRLRERAFKQSGHMYPDLEFGNGKKATVVAWLWVNTVPCSNRACAIPMPLLKTFHISSSPSRLAWLHPTADRKEGRIRFTVRGSPVPGTQQFTVDRRGAVCLGCSTFHPLKQVRDLARSRKMGQQLVAIVAKPPGATIFANPTEEHETAAIPKEAPRRPRGSLPKKALSIRTRAYGWTNWHDQFTDRQLSMLEAFCNALDETRSEMIEDGAAEEYATAVLAYLALAISRFAEANCRIALWDKLGARVKPAFGRQAIAMVWDFPELNPFADVAQSWMNQVRLVARVAERLPLQTLQGRGFQADAASVNYPEGRLVIVTDPPYYDNIGYADISDFFYIWLRTMLRGTFHRLFVGVQTPKKDEIVAGPLFDDPLRRFERLMLEALKRIRQNCSNEFPTSIYYAYKEKASSDGGLVSHGWVAFLSAVVEAGFVVVRTWPIRTEARAKLNAVHGTVLSSSVVLVLRPRAATARVATRNEVIREMAATIPDEIRRLLTDGDHGDDQDIDEFDTEAISLTDLDQAVLGFGMQIYSRYAAVEDLAGNQFTVAQALAEINRIIDGFFEAEEGQLDDITRFSLSWLRVHDFGDGETGDADKIARAKGVALGSVIGKAGVLKGDNRRVRLLEPEDFYGQGRKRIVNENTSAWEATLRTVYHMTHPEGGGVAGAAKIARDVGSTISEQVERLARVLFNVYDRKFMPSEAAIYLDILNNWREIIRLAGGGQSRLMSP